VTRGSEVVRQEVSALPNRRRRQAREHGVQVRPRLDAQALARGREAEQHRGPLPAARRPYGQLPTNTLSAGRRRSTSWARAARKTVVGGQFQLREQLAGKTVVGVLSGGNLDLRELARTLAGAGA
jgi:hypothetical protein